MINPQLAGIGALAFTSTFLPGVLAAKAIAKKTGKPQGAPGSIMHVATNDKLDKFTKKETIKEINKTGNKIFIKGMTACAELAGAAAVATSCSSKCSKLATKLTKLPVVKNIVKLATDCTKSKKLPTPAKAAIAVGSLAFAVAAPIMGAISAGKAGYIEGKHEAKVSNRTPRM